jgi:hypothetical protein
MAEVQTQVRLVDPGLIATRGVSTTLRRTEIERALAEGEYPAQLLLELSRAAPEGEEPATGEVLVLWQEKELNELLRSAGTESDEVALWFDRSELEHALAADFEAHGLRERTAMLAITVAAVGVTAGGAFAHPELFGDAGSGTAAAPTTQSFLSDVASSDAVARSAANVAAGQPVSDVASSDAVARSAANVAAGQPVSDVASSDAVARYEANVAAGQPVSDVASSDAVARYEANVAAGQSVSDVASSDAVARYEANVAAGQSSSSDALARYEANVASDATPTASFSAASSSSGLTAADEAAIAGGVALLITGAGFLFARTRRERLRPA